MGKTNLESKKNVESSLEFDDDIDFLSKSSGNDTIQAIRPHGSSPSKRVCSAAASYCVAKHVR
jgi:hypothetical protein